MTIEQSKIEKTSEDIAVVFNEPVPMIYIDGIFGAAMTNGTVRLNLYEEVLNIETGEISRYIKNRLVMPEQTFISMTAALNQVLSSHLGAKFKEAVEKDDEK